MQSSEEQEGKAETLPHENVNSNESHKVVGNTDEKGGERLARAKKGETAQGEGSGQNNHNQEEERTEEKKRFKKIKQPLELSL